ncbi:hypothetical protein CWB72_09000 [Pseudoalteromonas phenolica]|uniref:hypothetical protein n=1 Tax=Pseudoalteromonas phenolica TaxID=161398 RepID=UPI00110B8054|nr:hypothetical protein [Pseudoalteromonas phenolica]TMN90433.1 hypothetical protein CWB72_09000 [Pseudoalteromonas phenolica]
MLKKILMLSALLSLAGCQSTNNTTKNTQNIYGVIFAIKIDKSGKLSNLRFSKATDPIKNTDVDFQPPSSYIKNVETKLAKRQFEIPKTDADLQKESYIPCFYVKSNPSDIRCYGD